MFQGKRTKLDATTAVGELKDNDWTQIGSHSIRKRLGLYAKLSKSRLTGKCRSIYIFFENEKDLVSFEQG